MAEGDHGREQADGAFCDEGRSGTKLTYGEVIAAHIDLSKCSLNEAINVMADKGDPEVTSCTAMLSIASALIAISMVMYEERENKCGRYAHGHKTENGADHPEGRNVSGRKDPVQ